MYELNLLGANSIEVGEPLVIPFPLIDLLRMPMGSRIDLNELYERGGEINRWLIDRTPLKNNRKRVVGYVSLHYLGKGMSHVPTSDWHCDGSNVPFLADDIFHTMVGVGEHLEAQIKTEFLKQDTTLLVDDSVGIDKLDHVGFRKWITNNNEFESFEAEAGRMQTWTSRHLHRVQFAENPHFRFFWKVAESDHLQPLPYDAAVKQSTMAYLGNYGKEIFDMEQGQRGIILRSMRV